MQNATSPVRRFLMTLEEEIIFLGNNSVIVPEDQCYCKAWLEPQGTDKEGDIANALQWFAAGLSILVLIFYGYHSWKATTGWEEVYVCCVEICKVIIEFFHEYDSPATLSLSSGNRVVWMRYGEWLLSCPVILIHLSNVTGLNDSYSPRSMLLLISDVGCIVFGITCAMATGYTKIIFFIIACAYSANTFYQVGRLFLQAYHEVPAGQCRYIVLTLAYLFFASWGMFPILFAIGPEGLDHISLYASGIGHTFIDLAAKTCWGFVAHWLRIKIHEHILLHGDIRKKTRVKMGTEQMEVETLMAEEDDDTYKNSTQKYAKRDSFVRMGNRLKEKGFEVRASLDAGGDNNVNNKMNNGMGMGMGTMNNNGMGMMPNNGMPMLPNNGMGMGMMSNNGMGMGMMPNNGMGMGMMPNNGMYMMPNNGMGMMNNGMGMGMGGNTGMTSSPPVSSNKLTMADLQPGRVILAVPDISMVDFFREQFQQLPAVIEMVPALGADNAVQLAQQAGALGGCDLCLLHPEFLKDRSANGLVAKLRSIGQRVGAFGWSPAGPIRELIESAGVDGFLEGPSFGTGVNRQQLAELVCRMQALRRSNNGGGMGGGMMQNPGMGGNFVQPQNVQMANMGTLGGSGIPIRMGTNPLFGSAPSPNVSQTGLPSPLSIGNGNGNGNAQQSMSTLASASNHGASPNEAEMLQQLMAEIGRLKNELGENAPNH